MNEEGKTVESFSEKILRMFLPIRHRKMGKRIDKADLETVDPLERFEKAIIKDSEEKARNKSKELDDSSENKRD